MKLFDGITFTLDASRKCFYETVHHRLVLLVCTGLGLLLCFCLAYSLLPDSTRTTGYSTYGSPLPCITCNCSDCRSHDSSFGSITHHLSIRPGFDGRCLNRRSIQGIYSRVLNTPLIAFVLIF